MHFEQLILQLWSQHTPLHWHICIFQFCHLLMKRSIIPYNFNNILKSWGFSLWIRMSAVADTNTYPICSILQCSQEITNCLFCMSLLHCIEMSGDQFGEFFPHQTKLRFYLCTCDSMTFLTTYCDEGGCTTSSRMTSLSMAHFCADIIPA